jgi:hypothetical protein
VPIMTIPACAGVVYSQPFNTSNPQYWTSEDNQTGTWAQVWDSFEFLVPTMVDGVTWVGGYNGPSTPLTITGWSVGFYSDNSGVPGALFAVDNVYGNAGESPYLSGIFCEANGTCIKTYQYSVYFASLDLGPGTYWLSVVPQLTSPPDWGWGNSTGGPGSTYQCVYGTCGPASVGFAPVGVNVAFDLIGQQATPEPSSLLLLATGIFSLAGSIHRRP